MGLSFRWLGSVAIRCSQNASKQSSQTPSFKGMSSIRRRSRRPLGHASQMAQASGLRLGNRMTLFMAAPYATSSAQLVRCNSSAYFCSLVEQMKSLRSSKRGRGREFDVILNAIGFCTPARACCRASLAGRVGAWGSFDDFVGASEQRCCRICLSVRPSVVLALLWQI